MARKGENIYRRQDGRWEGRYICGRREDGAARYRSIYGRTYGEVRARLAQERAAAAPALPQCTMTLRELFSLWLADRQRCVKASSYARYAFLVERHILPGLGGWRVAKLTAQTLNRFLEDKRRRGRLSGRGGLSGKTVCDLAVILKSALRLAGRQSAVPPALWAELALPRAQSRRIEVLGEQESARLSQTVLSAPDLSGSAYLLSLNAGLRLGEICGLRWSDIDFSEGVLHVARTALRVQGAGLTLQTPKSAASDRLVPLTAELLKLLRRLRGTAPTEAFVLTGRAGKPMEPRTMQYRFQRFLQRHSFSGRNFHVLRHSFATRCIARGADAKTLSELLGHGSVKTTLQLYVHPDMEQKCLCLAAASAISQCA